jgi:hypothetical protein
MLLRFLILIKGEQCDAYVTLGGSGRAKMANCFSWQREKKTSALRKKAATWRAENQFHSVRNGKMRPAE